jgi:tetratricopeptide (TPR) repeat protein
VLSPTGVAIDQTVTAGLFLTPLYASPELLRGQPTTVASDLYSLGIILYELVCGRRPYHPLTLNPVDLIQAVVTQDAQRPSALVELRSGQSAEDSIEKAAELRGETPASLRRNLRGDLDSIVLKAVAKDPAERYGSVEQLSEDIRRYLEGQPVHAAEGSTMYRARKFIGRHRLGVASATLLAASLIAGLIGTLWEARVARQERANADRRFEDARKLANYLVFDLYTQVQKLTGSTPVQADMAARAMEYLDRLSAARSQDRVLRAELAEGYLRLGDVLGNPFGSNLGQGAKAVETYRKALAIAGPLAREAGGDQRGPLALAKIYQQLGGILVFSGKGEEGLAYMEKAAAEFDRLVAAHPSDADLRLQAAGAYQLLGRNRGQRGGWIGYGDRALSELEKSISHAEAALKLNPGLTRATKLVAVNYQVMGATLSAREPLRGLEVYHKSLELLASLPEPERSSLDTRRLRAAVLLAVGWDLGQRSEFADALSKLDEARTILEEVSANDPKNTAALYHCAICYREAGIVHSYAGHRQPAIDLFSRGIKVYDELMVRDPANKAYPMYRAELQARISILLTELGRLNEARPYAEAGIGYMIDLGRRPDATPSQLSDAARYLMDTKVQSMRNPKLALDFADRANRLAEGKEDAVLEYLARAYDLNGNTAAAAAAIRKALALLPPLKPGEKPSRSRQGYLEELAGYEAKLKKAN